jgi:very-short-patch-repair endonuclease
MLRTTGAFGFLSPSYRSAKRVFKSISRTGKFSKSEAVRCLDDFLSFRRKSNDFATQAQVSGLFGLHGRGLDTNFEAFSRLATFFNRLDQHFGAPQHDDLHTFLRAGPTKHLDLLPPLPSTGITITYELLQDRIVNANGEVTVLEGAIEELRDVSNVFRNSEIEPAAIRAARTRLEELLSDHRNLDRHSVARTLLGTLFNECRTNPTHFRDVAAWAHAVGLHGEAVRTVLARGNPQDAAQHVAVVLAAETAFKATLSRLSEVAKVEPALFTRGKSLKDAAAEAKIASEDGDGLFAYSTFSTALQEAGPSGILPLVEERLLSGSLSGLGAQLEALAVRRLAKAVYAKFGMKLTRYRGAKLDDLRASLAKKDKEIITLTRFQLRAKVKAGAKPPRGSGVGRKSTWTEMALIENEVSKKQKFISVRDLTQRAGNALIELKPCWMMSPLAVAQYVPKGSVQFDLCIIDEASQMPPESAIGALLRCDQAVVVGDTNQLPPSSFFKTLIEDEDADDDENVLSESVLELANGAFRPARRLRWHYRSQHSALIKFSNRLVYDDDLVVFPSATESMSHMGVEFRAVQGRYKAGTNPIEAKSVVEAIIEFMQRDPDRSLGVVTLNQKQRDLITEEFEYVIANNRAVQRYVDAWEERNDGLEYFFIKNLENVQGDERDVIFIGTVYGAEEPGARVMQRFGPINGLAGKRRLNVLFTRAKQKIVTFSSMTAADIEADEHSNAGTYMLKRWLEFSASGGLDAGDETDREPDSDFEVFVIDQIRAMGCKPVPQVGVAGYFVDIGIRHPEWPHGFILGVECDGATYHSAKSARDRDRLRQEVLEKLGWRLHRIWSTDWFNNPRQESEKLRRIISERLTELKSREHQYVRTPREQPVRPPAPKAFAMRGTEDLFDREQSLAPLSIARKQNPQSERRVEIGDTVRVRYLTDDKRIVKITISNAQSDLSRGVVHHKTPVATALLGAEEGDEVEVLVGSYIRQALVESIQKASNGSQ